METTAIVWPNGWITHKNQGYGWNVQLLKIMLIYISKNRFTHHFDVTQWHLCTTNYTVLWNHFGVPDIMHVPLYQSRNCILSLVHFYDILIYTCLENFMFDHVEKKKKSSTTVALTLSVIMTKWCHPCVLNMGCLWVKTPSSSLKKHDHN